MYFGMAWCPEHWSEERSDVDLAMTRDAGMNVVRVAEFAWSTMEPTEGQVGLDWLERAVGRAAEFGIQVVLGTPTATPPAWLTQRYPDVLARGPDGRLVPHGGRCHYNVCSTRYLDLCGGIASRMAERFGSSDTLSACSAS
jgi:beta-galactosidase